MQPYPEAESIRRIIDAATRIVVLQADNPDGDSLGSALALEQILESMGKKVYLYCAVDMPAYLHHIKGWDRVLPDIPSNFDASIIVDASTLTLFEKLSESGQQGWVAAKPCIVLDHHATSDQSISFADASLTDASRSSAGELIYTMATQLDWPLDVTSGEYVMTSILSDTQGLTNDLAGAETYRVMAALTELGVNRPKLEEQRREFSKMAPSIFKYKAELINRTELHQDNTIAIVTIPQAEINEYSPLYNPAPLIQNDMLQTTGVRVAIVLKHYDDGRILCAIRCNPGAMIAAKLAEQFGGGGHPYASGFKLTNGRPVSEVKSECIQKAVELLTNLEQDQTDETVQYAY